MLVDYYHYFIQVILDCYILSMSSFIIIILFICPLTINLFIYS